MPRRRERALTSTEFGSAGLDRIGRYQVQTSVGVGGFARVLRAYDESLDDAVAIKVLAENWAEDPDIRKRFVEEARLLRRVRSAHLVTVHDVGELADGRPYFVMEFADAGTLAGRLKTRRTAGLDPASARIIIETLSEALGALHAAGVIHRDVNPKNLLIRHGRGQKNAPRAEQATQLRPGLIGSDERLMLGDLGLAKDVLRSGTDAVSLVGGTAHYVAPEQADPHGTVGPAADVFASTGVLWECLTATPPPDLGSLARSVTGLDESWQSFFTVGLAINPDDRYPSMHEWRDAALACITDADVLAARFGARRTASESEQNPYMGLAAFQPEHADRFYGRSLLIEELVDRLGQNKMLVVAGPSGSGKSSLVRAGLIPAIAGGALTGSDRWPIALLTPGAEPLNELAYQLSKLALEATQQTTYSITGTDLAADPNRGRMVAEAVTRATGGTFIVLDQFEELFTQGPDRDGQQAVLDALAALVDPADSKVRVVLAVRADFYGTCASFPWLAEKITDNQVLVGPMTRSELREAIEEPARQAGAVMEENVIDAILEESGSEPGTLPLVSHALAETWRRRQGSVMNLAGYREAGGVSGAIAQTANNLYDDRFDANERAAVRQLMLRLVSPGEGTPDTRRSMPIAALKSSDGAETIARVAGEMTDARLLTISENTIEIAHEALIRTWPRLRQWIEESRDDLRMRQHIARAAIEWIGQNRNPDLLYRGTTLQAAAEWAVTRSDVLDPDDREFLSASQRAHEEAVAEQERIASRTRRIRRAAVSGLATLTVVAVIASVLALIASNRSDAQFSKSLATQSVGLVPDNPRVALALAVEAIARGQTESIEARTTLIEASRVLSESPLAPAASSFPVGDALSVAISPDGALVATGFRNGSIQLWEPMTGQPTSEPVPGHLGAINDIAFTPDGRKLITASNDKTIRSWDISDPSDLASGTLLASHDGIIWAIAISPDGSSVTSASEDGVVQEWDLGSGNPTGAPFSDSTRDSLSVAYSPDGAEVLAGNGRGELQGWAVATRQQTIAPFNAHDSDLWRIAYDPSGTTFVTASADGRVRVWSRAGGALGEVHQGPGGNAPAIAISPGDGMLFVGDATGRIDVWASTTAPDHQVTPAGHGDQIIDAGITSSGGEVVTLATDQTIRIWTRESSPQSLELAGHGDGAYGVAVGPNRSIASGDGTGQVRLFAPGETEGEVIKGVHHDGIVWTLAINADGTRLASGGADGTWWLVDLASRVPLAGPVADHEGGISAIAFARDAIVTGGGDGIVRMWDANGNLTRTLEGRHAGMVTAIAVSGDRIATSDQSGIVRMYDQTSGELIGEPIAADDNTVWDLAFSPDGSLLATASADETVTIWDTDDLSARFTLTPNETGATGVAFIDDATVASLAQDGTVRIWDVVLGRQLGGVLMGQGGPAWRMDARPGDGMFVTSGLDGTVHAWNPLDLEAACRKSAGTFDEEQRRLYLGSDAQARGCQAAVS